MHKRKIAKYLAVLLAGGFLLGACAQSADPSEGIPAETAGEAEGENAGEAVEKTGKGEASSDGSPIEVSPEKVGTIYEDDRLYTVEELEEQARFDQYLNEYFIDQVTQDTITLHYTVQHPEDFGIERVPATWGDMNLDEILHYGDEVQADLEELHSYSYEALNYEQRLTYDIMEDSLEAEFEGADYYLLDEVFSPLNGAQTQIPLLFSEYQLIEKQDIDDCLTLLEDVGSYVDALLEFERMRAEQGYFMSDESVDEVMEQCEDFLAGDENCILTVLRDRITGFEGLTEEEVEAYVQRASAAVDNCLLPAYSRIMEELSSLKGSRTVPDGLAQYEGGSDYYAILLKNNVGTSHTPQELIEMTEEQMNADMMGIYRLLMKDESILDRLDNYEFIYTDPEETLRYLADHLGEDFPEPVSKQFTLKYVHEAMETMSNPAYYMIPAVDNWQDNTIYVNQNPEYAEMDLFTTLAHEGFPGHLYQQTYSGSLKLTPLRHLVSYTGYAEGWATYVELQYGYALGLEDPALAQALALNASYNQGIYTRIDLGIHYEGWDRDGVAEYLQTLGISDSDIVDELYETLAADPAIYPAYYIGYLEIMKLRDLATSQGVSVYDFHKFLLEVGEAPFEVFEERMLEYFDIETAEAMAAETEDAATNETAEETLEETVNAA